MKIYLNQLLSNFSLIENDEKIKSGFDDISGLCNSKTEQRLMHLPIEKLRLDKNVHAEEFDLEFFHEKSSESVRQKCAYSATSNLWSLPFADATFTSDLEQLCTELLNRVMLIRTSQAVAMNLETKKVGHRYPDHTQIYSGLAVIKEFLNVHRNTRTPSIIAALVWIYFVRLHPFSDGNGRTSRSFLNFVFRDLGVIDKPSLVLGPIVYANLDRLQNAVFSKQIGVENIKVLQNVLLTYIDCVKQFECFPSATMRQSSLI
jgi:hypothetical protein